MTFDQLGLNNQILEAISYMGFKEATPVQEQAVPLILNGHDLIACAQTGTGKTAAFMLPVLSMITEAEPTDAITTLVIGPTRELAIQIDQQIQGFGYFAPVSSYAVYGGGDSKEWTYQKQALTGNTNVIVATPGKLMAHMNMGYVDFSGLKYLILDEADRMLDMGFFDDIISIISHLPKERQTLLFSATMPPKIKKLANTILKDPKEVSIAISKPAEGVLQAVYMVEEPHKIELVKSLINDKPEYKTIIIFTSTKKKVNEIVRGLKKGDYEVKGISSDLEQNEREEVMRGFRSRRTRVLVATDVLSRGVDVKDINLVINFDAPGDAEDYVHRVGRTARADTKGVALTLVNGKDRRKLQHIEELIGSKIMRVPLPPQFAGKSDDSGRSDRPNKKHHHKQKGKGGHHKKSHDSKKRD